MENLFVKELKIIKEQLKNKNNDKNNINQNDAFFGEILSKQICVKNVKKM